MRIKVAVASLMLLFTSLGATTGPQGNPSQVVEHLHDKLIEVMKKADQLRYQGRYQELKPVITSSYDFSFIAQFAIRDHWKELDSEQKSNFVATLQELTIANYASKFASYSGQQFTSVTEHPLPRGSGKLVRSQLMKSDGDKVQFDYLLHQVEDKWRIINVIVNGVSNLALKRAEYSSIIKDEGFPALIAKIEEKIANYAKE